MDRRPAQYVSLVLGKPLSTNQLYRPVIRAGGPRLIKTDAYKAFLDECLWRIASQSKEKVCGAYAITVRVPRSYRGDIDNVIKSCLDALKSAGVTDDDRHCERVLIERGSDDEMHVMVASTKSTEPHGKP